MQKPINQSSAFKIAEMLKATSPDVYFTFQNFITSHPMPELKEQLWEMLSMMLIHDDFAHEVEVRIAWMRLYNELKEMLEVMYLHFEKPCRAINDKAA